jgi:acyl-CoA synthetase (NDP forming)/RimJ/RimL family protein N-acetyltransferase
VSPSDVDERWAADVVLGNGETVHIRPIRPTDAAALAEFHRRQSPQSIYRRYFTPKPELSAPSLEHFTNVDFVDRAALVVERRGEFIGWASYERWTGRDDADAAFMVDDRHQGKGIATLLLEHLAAIARSNGIRRFTAEVLADNQPMLAVFSRAGWPVQRRFESGVIDLDFELTETDEFLDSVERREQRADSRAVARILMPRTIAVVGASDRPATIGAALWRHVSAGARGAVYPVNPHRPTVDGQTSWPTVQAIPDDVWLAVIAVPAAALPAVIEDCIASRVRGAVVVTAVDGTGIDLPALVARARSYGMRIIGPGSMGIAASRPAIGLQASLVPVDLPPGPVAISMQSGSLGASLLRQASRLQLGLSWFVSLGDKCDISGNDLLQFWEDDETTTVIAMYTESFGNPRKFARIARRVSRQRPIVAVRTGAAAVEPSGSALYHQAGLIEVPTVAGMLDTARVLATQPILAGPNVAVLANSRSPETLARAAIANAGLVPVEGPRALDWRSTPADYGEAIRAALADPAIDGVLVLHAPPLAEAIAAPVDEIDAAAVTEAKPVVAILLGGGDGPLRRGSAVPTFSFPEPAAAALGRSYAYARWRRAEGAAAPTDVTTIDRAGAAKIIAGAIARGAATLDLDDAANVLAAYGVAVPATAAARAEDAVAAARTVGYPVAVKAQHRHVGRSAQAGIALDLVDDSDVVASTDVMRTALGADAENVVVQAMVPPGLDLRVRSTDSRLGPLVAVGLGGSQADLITDEASRLAPLSSVAAEALIAGSRAGPALERAGLDAEPVADLLGRVAQLAVDHHEITLVDLNPVIVSAGQAWVTDAVIAVQPVERVEPPIRRLD